MQWYDQIINIALFLGLLYTVYQMGFDRAKRKWASDWDATADRVVKRLKDKGVVLPKDEILVDADILKRFEEMNAPETRRQIH